MLNRDFSKSKREYIKNNKALLIVLSLFIIVGIIVSSIFGFNTNPDFTGGYVVDVNIGTEISDAKLDKYENKINTLLNENKLSLYSVQIKGEGQNTTLEIKYTGKLTEDKINKLNAGFIAELDAETTDFEHLEFSKTVSSSDYVYTIMAGLIILLVASIFVIFRHNIAYALALMGAGLFSVLGLLSTYGILRLTMGMPIFFISIATLIYTIYESLILFEKMREVATIKEDRNDKSKHIVVGMKNSATRLQYTSLALFFVGFLFVVFGTGISRTVALGFMFAVILSLVSVTLVLPFVYNLAIEKVAVKIKKISEKSKKETDKQPKQKIEEKQENAEEVVEERYTQETVDVEVIDTKADTTNSEE